MSPFPSFFKQFELTYVVADERDVVRLRTNYRKEDVYLYRLQLEPEFIQGRTKMVQCPDTQLHDNYSRTLQTL
jgi:hypothetical protein